MKEEKKCPNCREKKIKKKNGYNSINLFVYECSGCGLDFEKKQVLNTNKQ